MRPPRNRGSRGRGRRTVEPPALTIEEARAWFAGNLSDDWFSDPISVKLDREEIIVTGRLALPKLEDGDDADLAARARIGAFREQTREQRMEIADRAQAGFLRHVTWAAECGDVSTVFTSASVPVMTRLDMDERAVLDTLIDAGVARSRSEAVAWCVQLVGENEADWIGSLREAMEGIAAVRDQGPGSRRPE